MWLFIREVLSVAFLVAVGWTIWKHTPVQPTASRRGFRR